MKRWALFLLLWFSTFSFGQLTIGVKFGGFAIHHQKVSPNYYSWSVDKKGRFVGYAGFSLTAGYQFNPFVGIKVIQTILPYDCAGKFSGITHIGIDLNDRIIGFENPRHDLSVSIGPMFYYRKNWNTIPAYYKDEGFMKQKEGSPWETKWIWHGGQIQYDFYFEEDRAVSTNFLPGFPYIYTFMTGLNQRF